MSYWLRRKILLPLLFLGAAALMVQCSSQTALIQHPNGMSCQSHSSSTSGGLATTTQTDCRFQCPDGRMLSLPAAVLSQSKDQLNFLFCGVQRPPQNDLPGNQTAAAMPALPGAIVPLLNQQVDICDPVKSIINFVFKQPQQDLTGKKLVVDIQGQQTPCGLSPDFAGELSCKLPAHTNFPTGIVVRVDDQVVNIFAYGGADCEPRPAPHPNFSQLSASAPLPAPGPQHGLGPHPPHPPQQNNGNGKGHSGMLLLLPV